MNPGEFIREYCIKSLVCCFSGGKDSLVATHLVMAATEGLELERYVVYVDTGVMLPIATDYVKDVCRQFGWPLTILSGHFFEKAEKYGMPSMRRRWCCYTCKLKPIIDFVKALKPQRAEVTGLRRDESLRRRNIKQIIYGRQSGSWKYAPIVEWNEKQVINYIKQHSLPMPPHYKLGISETCLCGVFSSKREMLTLKATFPDLFQKFVELEKRFRSGGAAFYFQNKPVYAGDLAKQKTLTEVI